GGERQSQRRAVVVRGLARVAHVEFEIVHALQGKKIPAGSRGLFSDLGHGIPRSRWMEVVYRRLSLLRTSILLLFCNTARFSWDALLLRALATDSQCQECPRSKVSGMCPVCTEGGYPRPPGVRNLLILKEIVFWREAGVCKLMKTRW